jgi:hypothetical protein
MTGIGKPVKPPACLWPGAVLDPDDAIARLERGARRRPPRFLTPVGLRATQLSILANAPRSYEQPHNPKTLQGVISRKGFLGCDPAPISRATVRSMASNLTGSTLSAAITAPINGSDNAPFSVNSCRVVLMQYSLFASTMHRAQAKLRPEVDSQ